MKERGNWLLYQRWRVEDVANHQINNPNNIYINQSNAPEDKRWHNWFFFRGSLACRQASPRYVDQHLGGSSVEALKPRPARHRKNPHTSAVTQRHEQSTRVGIRHSAGEPQQPLTNSPSLGVDTITKSPHQSIQHQPSRCGKHQE
jgi:hypothetical protein